METMSSEFVVLTCNAEGPGLIHKRGAQQAPSGWGSRIADPSPTYLSSIATPFLLRLPPSPPQCFHVGRIIERLKRSFSNAN